MIYGAKMKWETLRHTFKKLRTIFHFFISNISLIDAFPERHKVVVL